MALAIYHEARGETITGRMAVARVILNRTRSRAYPDTICGVVFQGAQRPFRCQFSFACDDLPDAPRDKRAWRKAVKLALAALDRHVTDCLIAVEPARNPRRRFRQDHALSRRLCESVLGGQDRPHRTDRPARVLSLRPGGADAVTSRVPAISVSSGGKP